MRGHWLLAFIGWCSLMTGCGTTHHSMVESGLPDHPTHIEAQSFAEFGEAVGTRKGVELMVASSQLFRPKSSHLTQAGTAKVNAIARVILNYPGAQVLVIAYTDKGPDEKKAMRFTAHQATRVMMQLVEQGVPAVNVNAEGNGSTEAVTTGSGEADRAKNRRVLFEINAP